MLTHAHTRVANVASALSYQKSFISQLTESCFDDTRIKCAMYTRCVISRKPQDDRACQLFMVFVFSRCDIPEHRRNVARGGKIEERLLPRRPISVYPLVCP